MTKRPLSSVTTTFEYLVGRSPVSAITQTPASGPFGPITTPLMSEGPAKAGTLKSNAARTLAVFIISSPRYGMQDANISGRQQAGNEKGQARCRARPWLLTWLQFLNERRGSRSAAAARAAI